MYASGIAPGRNTCATGLNSRQNSPPEASAMTFLLCSWCPQRPAPGGRPASTVCALRGRSTMRPSRECRPGQSRQLTLPRALPGAARRRNLNTVSGHADVRTAEIPVPEPDLTPETVIGRARALIPAVRDQQDEAERLGHHTPELDRQFAAAGFYRI